jgi:hypothetical protein
MLRGLNAIYLQAPHVRQECDIADLLFLTQSWSGWLLDHHELKEGVLLPSFETILGVAPGTLASSSRGRDGNGNHSRTSSSASSVSGRGEEADDEVSFFLNRVRAYASATHKDPRSYDAITFEALLVSMAEVLVPHLTMQIRLLVSMREMCYRGSAHITGAEDDKILARLPIPMVTITRTPSRALFSGTSSPSASASPSPAPSPPISPTYSTFSAASTSTSYSSLSEATNNSYSQTHNSKDKNSSISSVSFSLFPSVPATNVSSNNININNIRPSYYHHTTTMKTSMSMSNLKSPPQSILKSAPPPKSKEQPEPVIERSLDTLDTNSHNRLAKARALLEADARANKLMKTYLAADSRQAATMDRFVVLPMIVRLRDVTFVSPSLLLLHHNSASSPSLASGAGNVSGGGRGMMIVGAGAGAGAGAGGGNMTAWPRMSIPAVHAVADKLSPRYEGAWRFLPCDVWGRPRELPFLG